MKLILHGWNNEYTFWSKSKYSPKMPKMFEKRDNLAIIYDFMCLLITLTSKHEKQQ